MVVSTMKAMHSQNCDLRSDFVGANSIVVFYWLRKSLACARLSLHGLRVPGASMLLLDIWNGSGWPKIGAAMVVYYE